MKKYTIETTGGCIIKGIPENQLSFHEIDYTGNDESAIYALDLIDDFLTQYKGEIAEFESFVDDLDEESQYSTTAFERLQTVIQEGQREFGLFFVDDCFESVSIAYLLADHRYIVKLKYKNQECILKNIEKEKTCA